MQIPCTLTRIVPFLGLVRLTFSFVFAAWFVADFMLYRGFFWP